MKYCLNSRLAPKYLKQADQIKITHRDFNSIPQIIEEYPNKEIVCAINGTDSLSDYWYKELQRYSKINENIIISFPYFPSEKEREGFRFYTSYPVENFSEARALIAQGVEYLKLGSPLFFMMDDVAALKIPVRFTPNQSWLSVVPRENGMRGQWMRPEDVHLYDIIPNSIIEFDLCHVSEEEALFRIYNSGKWPGPLSSIVQNLNVDTLNRILPQELGEKRLNCGQRCMSGSNCNICPTAFKLATKIALTNLQSKIDKE